VFAAREPGPARAGWSVWHCVKWSYRTDLRSGLLGRLKGGFLLCLRSTLPKSNGFLSLSLVIARAFERLKRKAGKRLDWVWMELSNDGRRGASWHFLPAKKTRFRSLAPPSHSKRSPSPGLH